MKEELNRNEETTVWKMVIQMFPIWRTGKLRLLFKNREVGGGPGMGPGLLGGLNGMVRIKPSAWHRSNVPCVEQCDNDLKAFLFAQLLLHSLPPD